VNKSSYDGGNLYGEESRATRTFHLPESSVCTPIDY
jgi:hypothetical protein